MESVPNTFPGMFWGYLVIFGLIIVYVFYLAGKIARLEKRLKEQESTTTSRKGNS